MNPDISSEDRQGDSSTGVDSTHKYTRHLRAYPEERLQGILLIHGIDPRRLKGEKFEAVEDAVRVFLESHAASPHILSDPLLTNLRLILSVSEQVEWKAETLVDLLRAIGDLSASGSFERMLEAGLAVVADQQQMPESLSQAGWTLESSDFDVILHPGWLEGPREARLPSDLEPYSGEVRQIREADGLEATLRVAAIWQSLAQSPVRQTQAGSLFKRDQERLDRDEALSGPVADTLISVLHSSASQFWLGLARQVGLVQWNAAREELEAAPAKIWADLGVHLRPLLGTRWLTSGPEPSPIAIRLVCLLWLASMPAEAWIRLQDVETELRKRKLVGTASRGPDGPRKPGTRNRKPGSESESPDPETLQPTDFLLSTAYVLGLTTVAEGAPGGERLVRLTELGRYVLGAGPPPRGGDRPDQFLFIQPNFEIIAYRQGLTVTHIAKIAMLTQIRQIGSAILLQLTQESVHLAMQSGLTLQEILAWLRARSVRPLPDGVERAIESWAERRDRVTYYGSATLVEFPDRESMEAAVASWPERPGMSRPLPVAERLMLIEDESTIPFERFRLAGSRDYRREPEVCVKVTRDGIGLVIDPTRGDLFVEAEVARFAVVDSEADHDDITREYLVGPDSLRRAAESGMSLATLTKWYRHRTGLAVPPAVRLLWHGVVEATTAGRVQAARRWILKAPSSDLLDGMMQHPDTAAVFEERVGADTAVVDPARLEVLRERLRAWGIEIDMRTD